MYSWHRIGSQRLWQRAGNGLFDAKIIAEEEHVVIECNNAWRFEWLEA